MTAVMRQADSLSWSGVARLGIAQMALGALVVLATSTLNRVMVVELALPAIVPGLLVGLHYGLQVLRPRWGYASDRATSPTRWILGGMVLLAAGTLTAAIAAALIRDMPAAGLALAVIAYSAVGLGVGATGTTLLTLLAATIAPARRAASATIVWLMMIFGSVLAAALASHLLIPFSFHRLVMIVASACALAVTVTALATWRIAPGARIAPLAATAHTSFATLLHQVWGDRRARRFAVFVLVSMLAYSGQELILEPFAGLVFHLAPAGTAGMIGLQQGGVLAGMVLAAIAGSAIRGRFGAMRLWTVGGCFGSGVALVALTLCGLEGAQTALRPCLLALGIANGAFTVAALTAMMQLSADRPRHEGAGTSMGLFGAAQAIAFGAGGLISSGASDIGRDLLFAPRIAYGLIFVAEAAGFAYAAWLAARIFAAERPSRAQSGALESWS
jgi:BCD family chlorophyll transporter-like MFS transporter